MTIIETIIYSLVLGVFAFGFGFLVVALPIKRDSQSPRQYRYKTPCAYNVKETVDVELLEPPIGSIIDGDKAVDKFKG